MAKPEWGVKRQCAGCGARFYDLMLDPITCPECGTVYEIAALARGKRTRPAGGRADAVKKAVLVEDAEELDIDVELDDDDADDAVLDDVDDDDADDVAVAPVGGPVAEDEDDTLDADDDVLIEDDDDVDDAALDEFGDDDEEDETRR